MKKAIKSALALQIAAKTQLSVGQVESMLGAPKDSRHGDLAFPAFPVAKAWQISPPECAKKICAEVDLPPEVESATPIGPFVNFKFRRGSFSGAVVNRTINGGVAQLLRDSVPGAASEKIVIEYSSPNIAKPFHVGHLRATLIGNSLDHLYRATGFPTVSINHLGDWGTQFGFVWAGCEIWGKPTEPSVLTLVELYKKATALKEDQEKKLADPNLPDVNAIARAYFVDLEQGKPQAVEFWKWCSDISIRYLKDTYKRLGVSFDYYTGESFYSDKLQAVHDDLERAGLLKESQGAYGVDLGEQLGFARISTPDGRSLYLTRDLATAKYRAETFQFTRALYVVGTPQALHFQQIKAVLKAAGNDYADDIIHIGFGHVAGMKTRGGGEIIELNSFLDEAYERALAAYHEQVSKRPPGLDEQEVAEAVALAAIVFSTLSRDRLKDVHFSWDHALAFQGDSGPYLLYAYARMNGIREKAFESGLQIQKNVTAAALPEETAFQLALAVDDFPQVLARTIESNDPAHLAAYALDTSKAFSRAYNELKVVGETKETAEARLSLFECARLVLRETMILLGMKVLERM